MKVLCLFNNFTLTHLIDHLAVSNDALFDITVAPKKYQPIKNNINCIPMNLIYQNGHALPPMHIVAKYALDNCDQYDLIIAVSPYLQNHIPLLSLKSVPILCPNNVCSKLESDKIFTKSLLQLIDIPTPNYKILQSDQILEVFDKTPLPIVFKLSKADYRITSFGTQVFTDREYSETINILISISNDEQVFYMEDFVAGKEVSVHFLCNGTDWCYLGVARDYKKKQDGDIGINTGSTGCYTHVNYFTNDIRDTVFTYMNKILKKLNSMGIFYKGIMYLGIIIGHNLVPQILEINTRPGYPEFAAIINHLDSKLLLENFIHAAKGEEMIPMTQNDKVSVVVTIYHKNYNLKNSINSPIYPTLSTVPSNIKIIYSELELYNNVYAIIIAEASTRCDAADRIYSWLDTQNLGDYVVRHDIGYLE